MTAVLFLVLIQVAVPQMPLSIAGTDGALAAFANPAGVGAGSEAELYCIYNFRPVLWSELLANTTFAAKAGPLAAFWEPEPSRYGIALGAGRKGYCAGVRFSRDSVSRWDVGATARPLKWLSVSGVWRDLGHDGGRAVVGAAVRPLGNRLTLFGETWLVTPLVPMFGFEAEPLDGLVLSCRAEVRRRPTDVNLVAGVTLGLGRTAVGAVGTYAPREIGGLVRISREKHRTLVPDPARYIELKLDRPVADQQPGFSLSGAGRVRRTWNLLDLVRQATEDRSVRAMVIDLEGSTMSFAHAQELRIALARFRAAGKKVYAYGASFGMGAYYVASVADRIISHPVGFVSIPGVSAQLLFLKGTLEKLGIKSDYTRHGKYKSAVEMFALDSMSPANREQIVALVDAAYEEFVSSVSSGRNMSRETLEARIETGFFGAEGAKAAGLIDTFCYRDGLDSVLREDLGKASKTSEKDFLKDAEADDDWQAKPAIAVVYASGAIADGESRTDFLTGEMVMGAKTMVRAIRDAAKEKRVKAILLRIDSPGGDGYASDLIWHELEKAKKQKPVIVSMAGVAGSGGYYIACNANRIFCLPGTITGSIGVFDLKFVTEGLYNKLGARRQVVKRGEHADALSDVRERTPEEATLWQGLIDDFYESFVGKVAAGRHMTAEAVDSVGQGRVWAGTDAKRVGLVDELGGFLDAVEYAKRTARLKECDFVFYPRPRTGLGPTLGNIAEEQLRKALP